MQRTSPVPRIQGAACKELVVAQGANSPESTSNTGHAWELDYRPTRLRRWAIVLAVVVVIAHAAWGATLTMGRDLGVYVGIADQIAYVVLGLIWGALILLALRIRVRAGAQGVEIHGFLRAKLYPWDEIVGFTFPYSSQWARLELPAYEHVGIMAIQAHDGDRAVNAMRTLRSIARTYKPSAATEEAVADR